MLKNYFEYCLLILWQQSDLINLKRGEGKQRAINEVLHTLLGSYFEFFICQIRTDHVLFVETFFQINPKKAEY